jgi:putative transposase
LDLGIKYLVADSDGRTVENPQFLRNSLKKLRVAQRKISRRKKGSNRRKKASRIAARIHEKITEQRKDYYHKVSSYYVNNYDHIVMEDLRIRNMVRNNYLALSISDASWGMLRSMIACKAEKAGRTLTLVNPCFTSQKCHRCGEIVQKSLSVRTHICPHCLLVEDRDINAAKNILWAGVRPSGANVERFSSCVV